MKATRIERFGPPRVIAIDEPPRPEAGVGELLVTVKAAGVGNWDALVREGKVQQTLPLTLGSELLAFEQAEELAALSRWGRGPPPFVSAAAQKKFSMSFQTKAIR